MTVRVSFVRHGRTAWNADHRLLGWTDVGLDEFGVRQAAALGSQIRADAFGSIWTSDLGRAVATAGHAGWAASADARLREIDFGELEGLTWTGLSAEVRQALATFDGFVAPGGESTAAFITRLREFLDGLSPGSHLVVTHGGVIRAVLRICGVTAGFPEHGSVYTVDWTARRLLTVQTPTT
jgi:probable phosphoglycerate mutase